MRARYTNVLRPVGLIGQCGLQAEVPYVTCVLILDENGVIGIWIVENCYNLNINLHDDLPRGSRGC